MSSLNNYRDLKFFVFVFAINILSLTGQPGFGNFKPQRWHGNKF
jgi:hypothetical protein